MKKTFLGMLMVLTCLAVAVPAFAIPSLQLDIAGGTYDKKTETIVSTSKVFTLYAYLQPDSNALLSDKYYLSAAVIPQINTNSNLGSFTLDGSTINVTSGMVYGDPPIDTLAAGQGYDPGDLPTHGIFPTYFAQYGFTFNSSQTIRAYNTADGSSANGSMYWESFAVDVTGLQTGYGIHFDLYNTQDISVPVYGAPQCLKYNKNKKCIQWGDAPITGYKLTDIDIKSFAPFSHDAESCINCKPVPEPSTLLLLGSGLLGLGFFSRRRKG